MGWSFRKSINLGNGFRVNLSKGGVGFSFGTRGARVSVGPRGTGVSGGWGPFRYQKQVSAQTGMGLMGTPATPGTTGCAGGCLLVFLAVVGLAIIGQWTGCGGRHETANSPSTSKPIRVERSLETSPPKNTTQTAPTSAERDDSVSPSSKDEAITVVFNVPSLLGKNTARLESLLEGAVQTAGSDKDDALRRPRIDGYLAKHWLRR